MAKFLQDTVEEMAVTAKQKKTQQVVADFANFFEKVIHNKMLIKHVHVLECTYN